MSIELDLSQLANILAGLGVIGPIIFWANRYRSILWNHKNIVVFALSTLFLAGSILNTKTGWAKAFIESFKTQTVAVVNSGN